MSFQFDSKVYRTLSVLIILVIHLRLENSRSSFSNYRQFLILAMRILWMRHPDFPLTDQLFHCAGNGRGQTGIPHLCRQFRHRKFTFAFEETLY